MSALKDDEGYVVLPIIIDGYPPYNVLLEEKGAFGTSYKVRDIVAGLNFSVIKLPAGHYRWSRINFRSDHYFGIKDNGFNINVKPGVINYGGHLVIDINYRFASARYNYVNRSSSVIDELSTNYQDIYAKYSLEFAGVSPDPFIDFYRGLIDNKEEK